MHYVTVLFVVASVIYNGKQRLCRP